jgi:GT2 family glycosyltransferase
MNNKVLISVLNYCDFDSTKSCVESILLDLNNTEKVLIIDNNSQDESYRKLKNHFKELKVVNSKTNTGYAGGHKIAVDYAINHGFKFVWILNNDLKVRKDALKNLIHAYNSKGMGIYGSITLKSENPDIVNFGGGQTDDVLKPLDYNSFENFRLDHYPKFPEIRPVQCIEGSSVLIPTEIIRKHGFMRLDFFMYGEETDYCYRMKKLGISSYVVTNSVVIHKGEESFKEDPRVKYYKRRNGLYFEKTHYNVSIFKNIHLRSGWISILKYFIKSLFVKALKNETYYINLANIHAILDVKGKLT